MGSIPRIAPGQQVARGVFAPFALPGGSGRFIPNTNQNANAPRNVRILLAEGLSASAREYQRQMQNNAELMAARFESPSFQPGHSENKLAQYICEWFGPRLTVLLKYTSGVVSVELEMGTLRDGANLFLCIHNRNVLGSILQMPINVRTSLGQYHQLADESLEAGVEAQNIRVIENASDQKFSSSHIVNGVFQTSLSVAAHSNTRNHGIVISSECLFLVRNTTCTSVDISEAIPLIAGKLHPVAAIAWWAQRALRYPQHHIRTIGRAMPRVAEQISVFSTSELSGSDSCTPDLTTRAMVGCTGPHYSLDTRPAKRKRAQTESDPQTRQKKKESFAETAAVPGLILTLPLSKTFLAKKLRWLDHTGSFAKYARFEGAAMEFLAEYRSGVVYRCNLDGQDMVIKTANFDNPDLMTELCNEVEAYKMLQDLQGVCIPRIFSTGYTIIGNKEFGFIAMEFLDDPSTRHDKDIQKDHANALCALDQETKDQFFSILRLIHSLGVAHCDIRAANLLYAQTRTGSLQTPFIIDFGFAIVGSATKEQKRTDLANLQEVFEIFE
ncbi:hypothetical protein IWW48_003477 [Coemansia sp. RSA 1200]|nr:hypothetical protein IWW48_003477 [Coemansia sp. RSA 1200]